MKKGVIIGCCLTIILVLGLFVMSLKQPSLNKEALDLAFIVNQVDELGSDELQLNWQEMVAIIGIDSKKDLSQISTGDLQQVAQAFIENQTVLSFDQVLENLDLSRNQLNVAYENLEQLRNYGYVPQKTYPNSTEMQFINSVKSGAIENYNRYGILPSITIAQSILESDWGRSELAIQANNLFGIKIGGGWSGEVMSIETKEGFDEYIIDEFRSYPTLADSIMDHGEFLMNNPRYTTSGVFEATTYRLQAKALEEAGYSTAVDESGNKTYAKMLGELIRQYNLQLIDHEVLFS